MSRYRRPKGDLDAADRWSSNTRRAYAADWRHFERWALARQLQVLPVDPAAAVTYLFEQAATEAWPTVLRRRAAIARAHVQEGLPDPTSIMRTSGAWESLRRQATPTRSRSVPLTVPDLVAIVRAMPDGLREARDRAVLLMAFTGAFARSDLVAVDVGDLVDTGGNGYLAPAGPRTVTIVRGRQGTCPVRAVQDWMRAGGVDRGALFRAVNRWGTPAERLSASAVTTIVKDRLRRIGVDPTSYSARSLRTGFVHAALAAGVPASTVADQAGLPGAASPGARLFTSEHLAAMGL